ncbi:MAG: Shikimate dehydrogenase (NADP(+)) [Syntrophomonadaceae bacterium]|nr:Shikimate dehydrogenase (NADP(+)) [Bacillota bacterium]
MVNISGVTKVAGIFGAPVAHSLSPAMHNAAFAALQLPYVYVPFHVRQEDLPAAAAAVRALRMAGVNVTVPLKEAVVPLLDCLDDTAAACGAVNTVVNREGTLTGYNTDTGGFLDALRLEAGFDPQGKKVVILGAGGAARAVAAALLEGNAAEIVVLNRTSERAQTLAADLQRRRNTGQTVLFAVPLTGNLQDHLPGAGLVVNTLSVSFRREGEWLVDLSPAAGALFFDLRYGAAADDYLALADKLSSPALDGLAMLLYQGVRAFRLFTGHEPPLEVMRRALLAAARRQK